MIDSQSQENEIHPAASFDNSHISESNPESFESVTEPAIEPNSASERNPELPTLADVNSLVLELDEIDTALSNFNSNSEV